jgi:hypothetical protein
VVERTGPTKKKGVEMNVGSAVKLGKWVAGAALVAVAACGDANAASQIDSEGKGFVGKGDVQLIMMWNNEQLQSNARNLRFRMLAGGGTSWKCEGVNAAGKAMVTVQEKDYGVASDVAFDPRKNRAGQVTGFYLRGANGQVGYTAVGMCPQATGWQVQPTLVSDSIAYSGGEPALQFSADGQTWFELALTY